jgi:hypothetical protein
MDFTCPYCNSLIFRQHIGLYGTAYCRKCGAVGRNVGKGEPVLIWSQTSLKRKSLDIEILDRLLDDG